MNAEIDIGNYINQNHSEDYEAVIAEDDRWDVFYHLSPMRTSLLNWYEFREGSKLLEVGGGFGALTGLFCDRCAHVTTVEASALRAEAIRKRYAQRDNLDVRTGCLEHNEFNMKFDYVILTNEYAGQVELDMLVGQSIHLLKPDGIMLLVADNRLGIRNLSGGVDPYSGVPFTGLDGPNKYSFSKQEIVDLLHGYGLLNHKFYYPLPDYKLPQLVYSEHHLPQIGLQERLLNYYTNSQSLIANESNLYDDLIKNQVFEVFANSFLVECVRDTSFSSVVFAAVTTDRGRQRGFATTIHQNGIVVKRPLFTEGQSYLQEIAVNLQEIAEHGSSVIQHSLEANGLYMPYIKAPTLLEHLGDIVEKDKEKFKVLIDQLYACILQSSEHVPYHRNALRRIMANEPDIGVILNKAYLDMIPFNCFYDKGQLLFFDQEFVRDCYPAKYVLFRALKYTYLVHPAAEQFVPLGELQAKYGLTTLWSSFEEEERDFVADNRKYDVYKHFYAWTQVDKAQIASNRKLLAGEYVADFETIEKLNTVKEVQLDLLRVLVEVCDRNQLKYFAVHGTLLGAVRHRGFIPWDDDIDLAMPREDYEKLKKIAKDVFIQPYELQTNENDNEIFNGNLSKLKNSNTTGIGFTDLNRSGNLGIGIDIIALDYIHADPVKRRKQLERILFHQRLLLMKTYGPDSKGYDDFPLKLRLQYYGISRLLSRKWLLRQFNNVSSMCGEDEAGYMGTFTRYTRIEQVKLNDKQWFESSVPLSFEHLSLPAPSGYRQYLSVQIGKNYMKYPPFEQRRPHHAGIYLADIPYRRLTGTFRNTRNKKFVLFGSGQMFEHYMQTHGRQHPPIFIVDNDQAKWGTEKQGCSIRNPQELLNVEPNALRLVICNIHYRAIGKQLEQMGIQEYYIYIQNKEWL